MGLIDLLKTSILGWKGEKPPFSGETISSTLHNQSSINDKPDIKKEPSKLDEGDTNNKSKYNSSRSKRYLDKLPR